MTGTDFLLWALPRLHLRWHGFARNRRQVLRRIAGRRTELALPDLAAYRAYLEAHAGEWAALDAMCRVTISRFARERPVWEAVVAMLPPTARAWSAGCGAGEEPYTLAIAAAAAGIAIDVLATDLDDVQLGRARIAAYPIASLRELPDAWRTAFDITGDVARLREPVRAHVRFEHRDLRGAPPGERFDLIACRNLAFTYFDEELQRRVAAMLRAALRPGGLLVVGRDEHLPDGAGFESASPCIHVRYGDSP
jgi:chemotaxis protein methyltransferase CheR